MAKKSNKNVVAEVVVADAVVANQLESITVDEVVDIITPLLVNTRDQIEQNIQTLRTQEKPLSKAQLARIIYTEEYNKGNLVRKNVINRLKAEAGLTEAGAATYYQNIRQQIKEGRFAV